MKKRILSAILTVGMLFSCTTVGYVSAEENNTAGIPEKFSAIGITVDSMFNGEYITRGKFAELMVEFINSTAEEMPEHTSFIDVSTVHTSAAAINLLYERGYISGVGAYTFEPDRNITYSEALSVIVNVLGYKMAANYKGEYLQGILSVARDADLLRGVAIDTSATAEKEILYKILENALEADMMIAEYNGTGYTVKVSEKTALEFYHGILMKEGIISGNSYTMLSGANAVYKADCIIIDEEEYIADADMQNYLGYNVKCYYRDEDEGYTCLFVQPTDKNEFLTVDGDGVTGISDAYLQYADDNDRVRKASLDNVKIIYNGVAYTGYGQLSAINFDDTEITLLSNDGDKEYEVMYITKYSDYYVSNIDFKNEIVYDRKNNTNISLDSDECSILIYGADGAKISIQEIGTDAVLSVAESLNTGGVILKKAYVVNNTLNGIIEAIDADEGYRIGGSYYKLSANCSAALKLGQSAKLLLGKTGRIAAHILAEKEEMFGIYDRLFVDEENDERLILKIFTQDGEFVKIPVEKKLKIDDTSVRVTEGNINAALTRGNVILFEVKNEIIKTIRKPKAKAAAADEDFKLVLSGDYLSVRGNLLGGVVVGDVKTTKVINLPTDLSKTGEWSVYNTGVDFENLRNAKFDIYNFGEVVIPTADALIVYDMAAAEIDDTNSKLFVVKSITQGLDEDDMPVTQINLINQEGVEQTYPLKDTLDTTSSSGYQNIDITKIKGANLSDIDKGDIVRIATAGDGRVSKIEKILDCTERNDTASRLRPSKGLVDTTHYYAEGKYIDMGRIIYGKVGGYENNTIKFTNSIYPSIEDWKNNTNVGYRDELAMLKTENKVIVYDRDEKTSRAITRDEINNYIGKECVLRCNQLNTGEVIIYE